MSHSQEASPQSTRRPAFGHGLRGAVGLAGQSSTEFGESLCRTRDLARAVATVNNGFTHGGWPRGRGCGRAGRSRSSRSARRVWQICH